MRVALWSVTAVALALIAVPTLYLFVWSICGTEIIGRLLSIKQATFRWYRDVLNSTEWRDAIAVSVQVAVLVSLAGTCITAAYDYAKRFMDRTMRHFTWAAMILLLTNPLIAYSMSLRSIATMLNGSPWIVILLGHLAIIVPLQFLVFEAASRFLDTEMLNASRTLGASHWRTFFSVYMPNALRPMLAAVIIGAFVSFDELSVVLFTLEGATATVPLRIWRSISHVVEPRPAVVTSLVVGAAGVSWLTFEQLTRENARSIRGAWERISSLRKEFVGALAGVLVVHFSLSEGEGPWHLFMEVLLHVGGAVGGGMLVGVWKLHTILSGLLGTVNAEPRGTRTIARQFVLPGVIEDVDAVESLLGGGLVTMNLGQIRRLTAACFHEFTAGKYIGTDRHVPSRYYTLYPDYLETQVAGRSRQTDVRIVMFSENDLLADLQNHPDEVTRFMEMHWNTDVMLLRVDWGVAHEAAHRFELETPDVGIFDRRIALFFLPTDHDGHSRMMLRVIDKTLRKRLQLFLDELIAHSVEVIRGTSQPVAFRTLTDDERTALQSSCQIA